MSQHPVIPTRTPWHARPASHLLLLLAAAILPYLNTFGVPFYFDDIPNLVENPLLRDLPQAVRELPFGRGPALLSFALNHRFGGLEPAGYHAVNLAIHAGCVLLVWLLLRRILAPGSPGPLFGALLFAVHPLQTQAVTYVVQRMTSLSALFFIAACWAWLGFLDREGRARRGYYALALATGALAVLTKQNAAVLPAALLLLERIFRPGREWRGQLVSLLPFCLTPAWKTAETLLLESAPRYAAQLQTLQDVTPLRYLFTEFSVLWHYVRLLFLPVGQALDYGWPVTYALLTAGNLAALAGLLGLAALAWGLRRRRPLITFGIAWFFLTLSVESSIIPLDPVFEHRLYLPMAGFALIAIDLLRMVPPPRLRQGLGVGVILALALLTWQRNALWGDPVAFFEDNLRRRPDNVRVMVMLANAYAAAKRPDDGLRMVEQALRFNPTYDYAYAALGKMLVDQGAGARAIEPLRRGLTYQPQSVLLNEYLGVALGQAGRNEAALAQLRLALSLDPEDASILANLGVAHAHLGDLPTAIGYFEQSLQRVPDSEETLFRYASVLFRAGEKWRSFEVLHRLVAINPGHIEGLYCLGGLAVELGRRDEAQAAQAALARLEEAERAGKLAALLGR